MIESEGITENVTTSRTDVPAKFVQALGLENVMFEAANPEVFAWYIKNYGPDVNLFVDHRQIVQLECLRSGIWGTKSLWGRVVSYSDETADPIMKRATVRSNVSPVRCRSAANVAAPRTRGVRYIPGACLWSTRFPQMF
jgi:hypothetical protein